MCIIFYDTIKLNSTLEKKLVKSRTYFTKEQYSALNSAFAINPKPSEEKRKEIALHLGVEPIRVTKWYYHKRMREKVKTQPDKV